MANLGQAEREFSASEKKELTAAEMAAEFNVSTRTLRFYEQRELLRPRQVGRSRLYSTTDQMRMKMIVKGKELGFTLAEIHDLIGSDQTHGDIEFELKPQQIIFQIDHLERQRAEIDGAIARLAATHSRLSRAGVNEVLSEAREVLSRVRTWAGGETEAEFWYRSQPLAAFGDRTAESLVKSGQAAPLRDYLDSIALGGFA